MEANIFMNGQEVAAALGVSVATAYRIIQRLNRELNNKGFITMRGKVSRQYFGERFYDADKIQKGPAC